MMKKRFLVITTLLVMGSLMLLAVNAIGKTPKYKFIVIGHSIINPFWAPVKKGMEDAAKMLGVNVQFIGPSEFDRAKQVDMFESAIAKRVDGIAITMTDPVAFEEPTREALKKGIPVIAYNTDDPDSGRLAYIGEMLHGVGRLAGRLIAEHVPDGSEVLTTVVEPGHYQLEDRDKSAREILEKHHMKIYRVNTTGGPAEAIGNLKGFFRVHPNTKAVYSTAEDVRFVAQAWKELGYKPDDVYVIGHNLVPLQLEQLKEGYIDALMDQQQYLQGYYPVVQLYLYKAYGIHPCSIDTASGYVTRENSDIDKLLKLAKAGYR